MQITNLSLIALLGFTLLLTFGCKSKGQSEAEHEAQNWFGKSFTNCEGVQVSKYVGRELKIGSDIGNDVKVGFLEFKELSFSITEDKLSEADKLNGIEWVGSLTLLPQKPVVRYYESYSSDAKWSKWLNDLIIYSPSYSPLGQLVDGLSKDPNNVTPMVRFIKRDKEKWSGFPVGFSAPQCSDVPS